MTMFAGQINNSVGYVSEGGGYPNWRANPTTERLVKRWIKVGELAIYDGDDEMLDKTVQALYDLLHETANVS